MSLAAGFLLGPYEVLSLVGAGGMREGLSCRTVWQNALAFAIHLTPTFIVLALLGVGWRWPKVAGILVIVAGFWYATMPGPRQHLSWIPAIAGPAWLCGLLFLLSDG